MTYEENQTDAVVEGNMTEDQAKARICPLQFGSNVLQGNVVQQFVHNCYASQCMAWAWWTSEVGPDQKGYCRLVQHHPVDI